MRAMHLGAWLLGSVVALASCGTSKSPLVEKAEALADSICACKSDQCVGDAIDHADNEVRAALKDGPPKDLSDSDKRALQAAAERAERCARASSGR